MTVLGLIADINQDIFVYTVLHRKEILWGDTTW